MVSDQDQVDPSEATRRVIEHLNGGECLLSKEKENWPSKLESAAASISYKIRAIPIAETYLPQGRQHKRHLKSVLALHRLYDLALLHATARLTPTCTTNFA